MREWSSRGSGQVGSDIWSAIAGRVGSTFWPVGSDRVQEKWPVDNSDIYQSTSGTQPGSQYGGLCEYLLLKLWLSSGFQTTECRLISIITYHDRWDSWTPCAQACLFLRFWRFFTNYWPLKQTIKNDKKQKKTILSTILYYSTEIAFCKFTRFHHHHHHDLRFPRPSKYYFLGNLDGISKRTYAQFHPPIGTWSCINSHGYK